MEQDKNNSKSFVQIIESTLLSTLILIITSLFIICQGSHPIRFSSVFTALSIPFLFFLSITSFIFSGIFYYLNKTVPKLLYLLVFFFACWSFIFILSNSIEKKSNNEIPDIMDGVSEYITTVVIKFMFILLISNFAIISKNWYINKKNAASKN